ncbi:MAG: HIT domain-containing protein [Patescibacteria group bacterium]
MALIYESENFILESHEKPEIDRLEGGHIKIIPKNEVNDRTKLSPKLAIELMRFTIVAGRAMIVGMKKRGVDIGRINYQENGNWRPNLHIHLYGRAVNAKVQKYGDPIISGHQEGFRPLDPDDIAAVKAELDKLFTKEEFSDYAWGLSN